MKIRTDFNRQLRRLQDEVLVMGSMVEESLDRALEALKLRDLKTSSRIIEEDDFIDKKRFEIEDRCINLIATQQPAAGDLRALVAMLHISMELERMGDYAEGIARISVMIGDEPLLKSLVDIPRMADKAGDMLRRSLDSLVQRDTDTAFKVCDDDDEVDALYDQVYRELLTYMV